MKMLTQIQTTFGYWTQLTALWPLLQVFQHLRL